MGLLRKAGSMPVSNFIYFRADFKSEGADYTVFHVDLSAGFFEPAVIELG